jgi:hypothetical protein
MKRLRLVAVFAVCAATSILGGTAAAISPVGSVPAAPEPAKVAAQDVDQATVRSGSSLEKVRKLIPAEDYGGAFLDTTGRLKVMVTRLTSRPALDPNLDAPVDFVVVQHSLQDLDKRMAEVFQARVALAASGVRVLRVDANEITNTLDVAIKGPVSARARAAIAQVVPGAPLVVSSEVEGPLALFSASRVDDFAPWSAGTVIYGNGGACTSGPGVRVGSTEYMVTAAHCGGYVGEVFYQGHRQVPSVTPERIGTIAKRPASNLDAMLITANVNRTLYRSWYNLYIPSTTPWDSQPGQTVCTGGAVTGETCSLTVGTTNYCDSIRNRCGLTIAYRVGAIAAGEGDSGGPVYILQPGLRYSGTISGGPTDKLFDCPGYPAGNIRQCSSYVVFTRIQNTLSYFGASIA